MAIRKRTWKTAKGKSEAWIVDYHDKDGRHIKTFPTRKAAVEFRDQTGVEVKQGVHTPASRSITVAEAGKLWTGAADADGLERSTVRQYRQHLDLHIVPHLGDVKLSDLSAPMVTEFKAWLRDNGRSPAMVRKIIASLGALLADAHDLGKVSRNVVRDGARKNSRQKGQAKRQKKKLEIGRDIPTAAEINAALGSLEGYGRALFLTAARTGMRASELRALTWEDVDFQRRQIHVRRRADRWNQIGDPKSGAGYRAIPMTDMLANTLKQWKLACPISEQGLVFPNGAGNVENHGNLYARVFGPAWIAAGAALPTGRTDENGEPIMRPKYGIHALRHFFASWLINEKARGGLEVSLKRAQVLLGHSTMQMTADTYGHLLPATSDEAEEFSRGEKALLA